MINSNTSRDGSAQHHWSFRWLLAGVAVACLVGTVKAMDPSRPISEYDRDQWAAEQGFPGGPVYAITQTADGYLWIGTEKGLVRFDGLSFRLIQHENSTAIPAGPVLGLMSDIEGNLWIRMESPRLFCYRDGTFRDSLSGLDRAEIGVTAMSRGKDGEALFSALPNGPLRYARGSFAALASTSGLANFLVISMAETPDGRVWLGTRDSGLFSVSEGQISAVAKGSTDPKINCLLPIRDRELWVGTDNGIVRWNGAELTKSGMPASLNRTQVLAMIGDRDSNIWIGTSSHGLLRVSPGNVVSVEERDRRSSGAITALFEDREGNLWVGSTRGLQRLRDDGFTTYSASQGLPSETNGPVYADSGGRTWFAPLSGGLYWLKGGQVGRVSNAGFNGDVVYSIAGGANGELWIGRQRGGLTHLSPKGDSFTFDTYSKAEGLAQNSVYAVHQSREGSVWAGTISGGLSRFKDGRFTTYSTANGFASNTVTSILEAADGGMWFATPNGLCGFSKGRWRIYTSRDGLPPGNMNCLLEDSVGILWIGGSNSLAYLDFDAGEVRTLREVPESLHEQILGIQEDAKGALWIATSNHVLRVSRDRLLGGALADSEVREFDPADGLLSTEGVKRYRSVVADSLGRIWFSMNRGLSVVDPARLRAASVPALVQIEAVSADGNPVDVRKAPRIPAARQRITFSYAGLSLSVPERVRFRYRLDGFDHDWSPPITAREAVYTNLSPGPYRFRVIASNSDGVWNSVEAMIGFEIEPAFWQTWWFRLSCVLAFGLAALALYRFRLRQVGRQLNVLFEERLAERTRIAQELHDTLLQGFLSASMQLDVAVDHLPEDSAAKPRISRVLQLMRQVIEEGRNAVRGLRSSDSGDSLDLEQSFSRIKRELAVQDGIAFRVVAEGRRRPLHPVVRDEVYRIGREAVVNAFRHAQAKTIEVEVEYVAGHLRLLIRDDGCGIDSQVLRSGRDGHWGLSGMRERAERIGGRLKVWSREGMGTEVELSVPGDIAFRFPSANPPLRWFTRLSRRRAGREDSEVTKQTGK